MFARNMRARAYSQIDDNEAKFLVFYLFRLRRWAR